MTSIQDIRSLFDRIIGEESLEKAVFSRARDKQIKKAVALPFAGTGGVRYQIQRYTADNKVLHENLAPEETAAALAALSANEFAQTDLFTTNGHGAFLISSKGQVHMTVPLPASAGNAPKAEAAAHDRKKQYLLDPTRHASFLSALGVSDENGRLFDKKRAKFRQINRFLELLDDVYDKLPAKGTLHVCDLCCGKSYLTFAVYYYLTELKQREVSMVGVDLKADVIAYCGALADRLGCKGLRFVSADINRFDSGEPVDMVVSLHACDIATDMVLDFAVRKKAGVILSTPCYHHEMMHSIKSEELSFITRQSMLKQKLCDAATDALRCLKLEAFGYTVETLELVDPEETPKNVMIRAHLPRAKNPLRMKLAREEYCAAAAFLGTTPTLGLT